jgi:hypothetical protein
MYQQSDQLTKIIPMKTLLKGLILSSLLGGCVETKTQKLQTKQYIYVTPDLLYDNIITALPRFFMVKDNYFYFQGRENKDGFLKVIDLQKKEEVFSIGRIGAGPGEFRTPHVHKCGVHGLLIEDVNSLFHVYVNIDSLFAGKAYFISPHVKYRRSTRRIGLGVNEILYLCPENPSPLYLDTPDASLQFGITPFEREYSNGYDINQGHIAYNVKRELVVYASGDYPFIVTYGRHKNGFVVKAKTSWDFSSKYLDGKIILDNTKRGIRSLALSKDYIISIQRDYDKDSTDEDTIGWDLSKYPTTLFIYDYNLQFLKAVDMGMPIARVDTSNENNIIYMISVNPDYQLVKYDLDLLGK